MRDESMGCFKDLLSDSLHILVDAISESAAVEIFSIVHLEVPAGYLLVFYGIRHASNLKQDR